MDRGLIWRKFDYGAIEEEIEVCAASRRLEVIDETTTPSITEDEDASANAARRNKELGENSDALKLIRAFLRQETANVGQDLAPASRNALERSQVECW